MNVDLVSANFWPEPTGIGPYAKAYADLLHDAGHEITAVCAYPHYPQWRARESDDRALPYVVHRCRAWVPAQPTAARRALFEASFAGSAYRRLRALEPHDLALAVSPSVGGAVAAARWRRRGGCPSGSSSRTWSARRPSRAAQPGDWPRSRPARWRATLCAGGVAAAAVLASINRSIVTNGGTYGWPLYGSPPPQPTLLVRRSPEQMRRQKGEHDEIF